MRCPCARRRQPRASAARTGTCSAVEVPSPPDGRSPRKERPRPPTPHAKPCAKPSGGRAPRSPKPPLPSSGARRTSSGSSPGACPGCSRSRPPRPSGRFWAATPLPCATTRCRGRQPQQRRRFEGVWIGLAHRHREGGPEGERYPPACGSSQASSARSASASRSASPCTRNGKPASSKPGGAACAALSSRWSGSRRMQARAWDPRTTSRSAALRPLIPPTGAARPSTRLQPLVRRALRRGQAPGGERRPVTSGWRRSA